jgi:hypothetical protein
MPLNLSLRRAGSTLARRSSNADQMNFGLGLTKSELSHTQDAFAL